MGTTLLDHDLSSCWTVQSQLLTQLQAAYDLDPTLADSTNILQVRVHGSQGLCQGHDSSLKVMYTIANAVSINTCGNQVTTLSVCDWMEYVTDDSGSYCDFRCQCDGACVKVFVFVFPGANLPEGTFELCEISYHRLG